MKILHALVSLAIVAAPLVLLASPTDRKIEETAKASYNFQTILENNVKVKADDGVVTLTGTVADKDQKELAADTVENLPGVVSVKNELKTEDAYPEHSDIGIAFKIRARLLTKANVSATSTKANVKDGHVVLTGAADNVAQKELTELYAKEVEGVKSVKNDIVIKAQPVSSAPASEKVDDASITSQVKYALLKNKATSAVKTHVSTKEGVVMITGEAENDAEKSLVSKMAESIRGVRSVKNDMSVKAVASL
ncbi:MAG: BON domain-containing protein [Nibricoccus sp.]